MGERGPITLEAPTIGWRCFVLNKLVKDNVFFDMLKQGHGVSFEILEGEAFIEALRAKVAEEEREFNAAATNEEKAKECTDILDIARQLIRTMVSAELPDSEPAGELPFSQRIFVTTLCLDSDNPLHAPWIDYYASRPERFREIPAGESTFQPGE